MGEITRPIPQRQSTIPAPAPTPQQQASAPAPAPAPAAEPRRRGGIFADAPPLPGFGRNRNKDKAGETQTAQKPAPAPAPAEPRSGGFRLPGFGGGASTPSAPPEPRASLEDGKRSGGILPRVPEGVDPITYRAVTLEGLAKGVKDDTLPHNIGVEVTVTVDARFVRQIVVDLRGGGGLAVSRREGDCIQILLPWQIDQDRFDSGRYRVRGIYRRTWFDREFVYEGNRYEMSCGDAYLFVRNIERAP